MPIPNEALSWMREGEAHVLGYCAQLDDDALAAPSQLPGWDRAHVVGHLARNADALQNLVTWARSHPGSWEGAARASSSSCAQ